MKKPAPQTDLRLIDLMLTPTNAGPSIEEKVAYLEGILPRSPETATRVCTALLERIAQIEEGLNITKEKQQQLRELLDKLLAVPWHPAVFLHAIVTPNGERALVHVGNARRLVGSADGVDISTLASGDEVFLSHEMNVIVGRSPCAMTQSGEIAAFERRTPDGRIMLRWRDEVVIADAAACLKDVELKNGDTVRFDRSVWIVYEKVDVEAGRHYLLDEVPNVSPDQIGGQDENVQTVLDALTTILVEPQKAQAYQLNGRNTILMIGPPGCGKTLIARAVSAEIGRISGSICRFAVAKPAEWESPWVGQSQKNIRDLFDALRQASEEGFAVLFLDEIEAVGRIRGHSVGHHSDKFLAALLAELDGFSDRRNVAIIAATNRKDLVDPALLERLSDIEVQVCRPNMEGARAIFQIHLPPALPFSPNGSTANATREHIIDLAVSRFYSPNSDNDLCKLGFRNGKERTVAARELVSGRIFEQVCRAARRAAYLRDVHSGEPGIRLSDMEDAVAETLERMRTMLTIHNAHAYLSDLPQDNDVVRVEPIVKRVARPHRFLNLNAS